MDSVFRASAKHRKLEVNAGNVMVERRPSYRITVIIVPILKP